MTNLEILRRVLAICIRRKRLARYATWTREEFEQFEEAVAAQRVIDQAAWEIRS